MDHEEMRRCGRSSAKDWSSRRILESRPHVSSAATLERGRSSSSWRRRSWRSTLPVVTTYARLLELADIAERADVPKEFVERAFAVYDDEDLSGHREDES